MSFDVNEFSEHFFGHLDHDEQRHFIEVCYQRIITHPDIIVESPTTDKVKKNSINVLIKYFENTEEYEKCGILKKLIDHIESHK
jgi:hypothetical protein